MELRVLEYFLALTQEGSISAAAKALNVSQPTLSRQLMDLEKELGCVLFERSKQGIILTDDACFCDAEQEKYLNWSILPNRNYNFS